MANMKDQKPLRLKVISMGNAEVGKVFSQTAFFVMHCEIFMQYGNSNFQT